LQRISRWFCQRVFCWLTPWDAPWATSWSAIQLTHHSPVEPEPKVHYRLDRAVRFCCGGFRPHTPVTLRREIFLLSGDFAP
jgi:hypothetical protein